MAVASDCAAFKSPHTGCHTGWSRCEFSPAAKPQSKPISTPPRTYHPPSRSPIVKTGYTIHGTGWSPIMQSAKRVAARNCCCGLALAASMVLHVFGDFVRRSLFEHGFFTGRKSCFNGVEFRSVIEGFEAGRRRMNYRGQGDGPGTRGGGGGSSLRAELSRVELSCAMKVAF